MTQRRPRPSASSSSARSRASRWSWSSRPIDRLSARVNQERLALVPLRLYFREGRAKVELGLAKGRQKGDKRQAIAERDSQREIERALGRRRKGME